MAAGRDWASAATFHDEVEREARADYDPFPDDQRPTEAELALDAAPWSGQPAPPFYQHQHREKRDQEQQRVDDHAAGQREDKQDHDDCDEHD